MVDSVTHADDAASLTALGVVDCPGDTTEGFHDVGFLNDLNEWLESCRRRYKSEHNNSASWDYLEPSGLGMPGGWRFLPKLVGTPNATLTERFLARIGGSEFPDLLAFGHRTTSSYPRIKVRHPLSWFLLKHGTALVGRDAVGLNAVFERRDEPALAKAATGKRLVSALDKLKEPDTPVPATREQIRGLWLALFKAARNSL